MQPLDTLHVIDKVSFAGVLHLRSDARKRNYLGPLFRAQTGDLIISKIRVGQGSFCMVSDDTATIAVSPEYPVYRPDPSQVDGSYLSMGLRCGAFMRRLRGTGNTTKQRITPAQFERQRIPLPSLPEQQAMVAAYQVALDDAAGLEAEAAGVEAAGLAAFEAALGLSAPAPLPRRPVFIARFAAMERWSHDAALRASSSGDAAPSPHPTVRLGDVVADLENGWSPKCLDRPARGEEWGVLKLGAVSFGVFDPTENKALPGTFAPRPGIAVKAGDLLISRGNVARLVGAAVYVDSAPVRLMMCDLIFRAVPYSNARADLAFVAEILRLPQLRRQIEDRLTGTSPTMKKITKPALLSLTFPLPTDLAEQRALIAALDGARAAAAGLRAEAAARRRDAWAAFEAAIYGEADGDQVEGGRIDGAIVDP